MDWAAKIFSKSLAPLALAAMAGLVSPALAGTEPPAQEQAVAAQPGQEPAPLPPGYDPDTMELAEPAKIDRAALVAVDNLAQLDPEEVGLYRDLHSKALWRDVDANVARHLIDGINQPMAIAAVRELALRFLTNGAVPPQGELVAAEQGRSLLGRRVGALWNMGLADPAGELAAKATSNLVGPTLARVRGESLVMSQPGRACDELSSLLTTGVMDLAAQIKIICAMGDPDKAAARLGLDFMREDPAADPLFIAAMDMAFGQPWPKAGVKAGELGPVHVAAFKVAGKAVPPQYLVKANAPLMGALALDKDIPADQRLELGAKAALWGLIPAAELQAIYLEQSFAPEMLADPLVHAKMGNQGQALLLRAAMDQTEPALKLAFVARALQLASQSGQMVLTAQVFEPLLAEAQGIASLEPDLNRAMAAGFIALGQWDKAVAWAGGTENDKAQLGIEVKTAQAGPTTLVNGDTLGQGAGLNWGQLWPFKAIRDARLDWEPDATQLRLWLDQQSGEQGQRRKAVVLAALTGLGANIPDWAWIGVEQADPVSLARFTMLQQAALDARMGAVLVLVSSELGVAEARAISPLWLSESLSALAVIGFGEQARAIAAEAVWAQGL